MFPKDTKILIIDDAAVIRKITQSKLMALGFSHFYEANNGLEALEILKTCPDVELVICDLNMPRMDGLQLLQCIRKEAIWKNLPFILLTIDSGHDKIVEAIRNQCTQYIVKPLTDKILKEKLQSSWEKHFSPKKSA
jgi:two-component system, chemotaxis family, chemotaxis protein CheY